MAMTYKDTKVLKLHYRIFICKLNLEIAYCILLILTPLVQISDTNNNCLQSTKHSRLLGIKTFSYDQFVVHRQYSYMVFGKDEAHCCL